MHCNSVDYLQDPFARLNDNWMLILTFFSPKCHFDIALKIMSITALLVATLTATVLERHLPPYHYIFADICDKMDMHWFKLSSEGAEGADQRALFNLFHLIGVEGIQ